MFRKDFHDKTLSPKIKIKPKGPFQQQNSPVTLTNISVDLLLLDRYSQFNLWIVLFQLAEWRGKDCQLFVDFFFFRLLQFCNLNKAQTFYLKSLSTLSSWTQTLLNLEDSPTLDYQINETVLWRTCCKIRW